MMVIIIIMTMVAEMGGAGLRGLLLVVAFKFQKIMVYKNYKW